MSAPVLNDIVYENRDDKVVQLDVSVTLDGIMEGAFVLCFVYIFIHSVELILSSRYRSV